MSAVQNDTLKINHCVNRVAPVSIYYRDWPASLGMLLICLYLKQQNKNKIKKKKKKQKTPQKTEKNIKKKKKTKTKRFYSVSQA